MRGTPVGELFQKGEYFVPEVLHMSDSLFGGLEILKPHLQKGKGIIKIGKVIIRLVRGQCFMKSGSSFVL